MKKLILLTSFLLLGACAGNKVIENKPVNVELHIVHVDMKSYDVMGTESKKLWSEDMEFAEIIKELPNEGKPKLVYSTEISSNWDQFAEIEYYNFTDEKWKIKNKEKISSLPQSVRNSTFKFGMTPLNLKDVRVVIEMRYKMDFLTEILELKDSNGIVNIVPITETFQDSKSIEFLTNRYQVFSTMQLKDKTSLILFYKIKN
jgi:hypothetical protein